MSFSLSVVKKWHENKCFILEIDFFSNYSIFNLFIKLHCQFGQVSFGSFSHLNFALEWSLDIEARKAILRKKMDFYNKGVCLAFHLAIRVVLSCHVLHLLLFEFHYLDMMNARYPIPVFFVSLLWELPLFQVIAGSKLWI